MTRPRIRRGLGTTLRLVVGAALLAFLMRSMDLSNLGQTLAGAMGRYKSLAAGIMFTFLGLLAGAFRWKEMLAVQRISLRFSRIFTVFFIGQFFNAFMLGACGGDVARAYYASQDTPGRRAEAVITVFADRAIGLLVMIFFCCLMILARVSFFVDHSANHIPAVLMFLLLAGSLVMIFMLFRKHLFEQGPFFQRLEETRAGPLIRRTYEAFYLYRRHRRALISGVLLSLLNFFFLTIACACFGRSIEIDVSLIDYLTLFPIISVIAAIPITPGSLGVREGLFVAMFETVGVKPCHSISISLLVFIGGIFWSLFGGLMFLGWTASSGNSLSSELQAVKRSTEGKSKEPSKVERSAEVGR